MDALFDFRMATGAREIGLDNGGRFALLIVALQCLAQRKPEKISANWKPGDVGGVEHGDATTEDVRLALAKRTL